MSPLRILSTVSLLVLVGGLLAAPTARAADQDPSTLIVITEQSSEQIIVMDPQEDWATSQAQKWSWAPGPGSELNAPDDAWHHPDDARLRTDERTGEQFVMVADSFGLLAQVPYPDGGKVAWSTNGTFEAGPHGIELLPDGNVAAAASKGGWVRIYTASQGRTSEDYAESELPGAHQVWWDEAEDVLWAIGDDELVSFTIGGTAAEPTIERASSHTLPTRKGHDLQPVSDNPDRLWLTTQYGVYQFRKGEGTFDYRFPRYRELYATDVKSVATDRTSGAVLETVLQPGNDCSYCTDTVDLYVGDETVRRLTLPGGQIYRARWFAEDSN